MFHWHFTQMWLFILAGMLQTALIVERILNRILSFFFALSISEVQKLALGNLFIALLIFTLKLIFFPFALLLRILKAMWSNAILALFVLGAIVVLSVLAETSGGWTAAFLNVYNSGIGVTIQNDYIQPLVWLQAVLGMAVRAWNMIVWILSKLFFYVMLPSIKYKPDNFLVISGNAGLFVSASVISVKTSFSRAVDCIAWKPGRSDNVSSDESMPFMQNGLHCVGNKNYMVLDVMTPSIYLRKMLNAAVEVITAGCSAGDLVIQLTMYPLLDYSLYKALHCLVNTIVHVVVILPIVTYQRCEYGKVDSNAFSEMEKRVMCVPDFTMTLNNWNAMLRAVGQLVDNWGNFGIIVLERATGSPTAVCRGTSSAETLEVLWEEASRTLGSTRTTVAMSESLYAVTDGVSTVYTSAATAGKHSALCG